MGEPEPAADLSDRCSTLVLLAPVGCRLSAPLVGMDDFAESLADAEAPGLNTSSPADQWQLPGGSAAAAGSKVASPAAACPEGRWSCGSCSDEANGDFSSSRSSLNSKSGADAPARPTDGPAFIDLGHPDAKLMLLLLGGRDEARWSD
ncbi:unnamed protein product [Prorocentrum cordatum]|uniref:Uncharacterized protein n=1 Tax=Prorocentrum cordatum TaxID=2364126 RepID=A0ABN9X6W5_9DINO|nr:unnamed protein product [Polarella glacialis]|mmetsp:Transcript_34202/g.91638  ORF Transcript_34202/g.91638 Transcript_34202/m.91638 type:complete len:148 (+) Transcript_34202:125-568(+)